MHNVTMDPTLTPLVGSSVGAVILGLLWYLSRRGFHSHCWSKSVEIDLDLGTPPGDSAAKVAHLSHPSEPESYQAAARETDGKASSE